MNESGDQCMRTTNSSHAKIPDEKIAMLLRQLEALLYFSHGNILVMRQYFSHGKILNQLEYVQMMFKAVHHSIYPSDVNTVLYCTAKKSRSRSNQIFLLTRVK